MQVRATALSMAAGILLGAAGLQLHAAIPAGPPAIEPTPGAIIGQVNAYLGNFLSKWSGATSELQFSGSQSWARNDTVATTMTSLGPQGSHTTIQEWLVVVNPSGTVRFIPAY